MAQVTDAALTPQGQFSAGFAKFPPTPRTLLTTGAFFLDFTKLLAVLTLEGADATPGDDQGIDYLQQKSEQDRIVCFTGDERGTSSRCPVCGHRHKPKGRNWRCKACGFEGHRDIVGAVNMHPIAYGQVVSFPKRITYTRPGSIRRGSSPDTGHRPDSSGRRCLAEARNQAPQYPCAGSLEHAHKPCHPTRSLPALAG